MATDPTIEYSYAELVSFEVGGPGTFQTGGGFIGGGGIGLSAAEGMAVAGLLNKLTTRRHTSSFVYLTAYNGSSILHSDRYNPDQIRNHLIPIVSLLAKARDLGRQTPQVTDPTPQDSLSKLERLGKLKSEGVITDEEFLAMKAQVLKSLVDE